jgi:putative PEP-CTERM system histidine kinase
VVNLAELRSGFSVGGSEVSLPEWASEISDMWLIVPLISSGVLVGFVILLTPRTPIDVNWEVLELLKMAGRQAASYFARMQATEALIEARKFDAFNRMSAFVVHDLKNLVAQMSLMLRNAERHKDNPEFQADMLDTVRHVEERMRGLMTQLMGEDADQPAQARVTQRVGQARGAVEANVHPLSGSGRRCARNLRPGPCGAA